jgi:TetR/AcrR family transcriptional repressor of mexJK operon
MKSSRATIKANRSSVGRPKDAAKRDGIIRAAASLFFRDGYELTSLDAVAKKADVSKLTIYSHFANKDELFKHVVRDRCDKRAMPQSFMTLAGEPVDKALTTIASNMMDLLFSPDSIRLHRIMQSEAMHHPKTVQTFYEAGPKRVRAAFADLLREWCKHKQLDIPDAVRATEQFFSLLKGEMMMRTLMLQAPPPNANEAKKHVQATVDFFLAAYRFKSTTGVP